ncbi:hypothetical protein [Clostridium botulinum]|uniref:hypothetical protein n=1 Tax=Clostridium botulinum TaxID=1491 RepID=UPI0001592202|nr:hypothetical protein [Clostridium botulinum]EPS46079.1 hypothetical protein CFSAN002369_28401 [Clostridium botulinum CFSAN002369]ABS33535.1 hypothetical protein CLB_2432 [Clostridium botulinum A str. ATCC 19397]ABS38654.1 hypothetical protein CLC_2414 [Clostridium botulinum A str. Hall]AWB31509.1 hypothetical protein DBN47_14995 [Clostridium botulinum]KOR54870.1 hypothetical protein ADT23_00305 [Clostridium botulinum]
MSENIKEIFVRIEYLEKLINSTQQWVILTWAILGVIVAVLSITITILVKKWVDKKVEEGLIPMKEQLIKYIKDNPEFYTKIGEDIIPAERLKNDIWLLETIIRFDESKDVTFPPKIELYYRNIDKDLIRINDYSITREYKEYKLGKNDFIINFKKPQDISSDYKERILHYNIIWKNNFYK